MMELSEQSKKRKVEGPKTISTSRGNHTFQKSNYSSSSASHSAALAGVVNKSRKQKTETDLEILAWLGSCGECCSRVPKNGTCCLLQNFVSPSPIDAEQQQCDFDFLECLDVVKSCRKMVASLKSEAEFEGFTHEQFRKCIDGPISQDATGKLSFKMKWQVGTNLHHKSYEVCRKVFLYCYDISEHHIKEISKAIKASEFGYVQSTSELAPKFDERSNVGLSFNDARTIFIDNQVSSNEELFEAPADEDMIRNAIVPFSISQRYCIEWLKSYFEKFADHAPDRKEHKLNLGTIKHQYETYYLPDATAILENDEEDPVSYQTFCQLWRVLFPQCINRPYCSIPGHCRTCAAFDDLRQSQTDKTTHHYITQAHVMHRGGLVMLERESYSRRRLLAMSFENRARPTILSLIIDLEDSNKTKIPYCGGADIFSAHLAHHLVGVKVHGKGVTFYPFINTIQKGANLVLFILFTEIEKFYNLNGYWPTEVFAQIDGGAEFANRALLAGCEWLVAQRKVKVLTYTRLPTGHTHEDIDAVFGVVWNHFHSKSSCLTLEDFVTGVQRAFRNSKLKIEFHNLLLQVGNYETVILSCIDPDFRGGFKLQKTQHQWRFEAVLKSVYFPIGVKTCYRRWATDRVIEFEPKPPQQCISPIGRHTGLEPVLVYSIWHPTKELNPDRPVEGFYILREMPHIEALEPAPFHKEHPEECVQALKDVEACIKGHSQFAIMGANSSKREWWDNFFSYFPDSADPHEYRIKLESLGIFLGEPLKCFLYNSELIVDDATMRWGELGSGLEDNVFGCQVLPEIRALAGNCIRSDFNPQPVHPKLYSANDQQLEMDLRQYNDDYATTFEELLVLRTVANSDFHKLLVRKVSYDGNFIILGTNTARKTLLTRWQRHDSLFLMILFRRICPTDERFVRTILVDPDDKEVVGSLQRPILVHAKDIKAIMKGLTASSVETWHKVISLFQHRDDSIFSTARKNNLAIDWLPSKYCYLEGNPYDSLKSKLIEMNTSEPFYRLYCLFHSPLSKNLCLTVVSTCDKTITVLGKQQDLFNFCPALKNKLGEDFNEWTFNSSLNLGNFNLLIGVREQIQQCRKEDSGIVFLIILYCLVHECYIPRSLLDERQQIKYKYEFAYWIAKGNLPM